MIEFQSEALPFSPSETISLANGLHELGLKYGTEHFHARLEVAARAYATLLKQGFGTNLPQSLELTEAGAHSSN